MPGLGLGLGLGLVRGRKAGPTFPLTFNPTGLSEFPSYWEGSNTFVIVDDVVINSPTFGPELMADPGLETYSGEDCTSLIFTGGTRQKITSGVHGGLAAQGWTPDANYQAILDIKVTEAREWYKMFGHLKRTAGGAGNIFVSMYQTMAANSRLLSSATYVQLGTVCYSDAAAQMFAIFATNGAGTFDTIVLDTISWKKIVKTTLPKLVRGVPGLTSKIRVTTWDTNSLIAAVSHSDGTLENCLIAYYAVHNGGTYTICSLAQFMGGIRTELFSSFTNYPSEGGGGASPSNLWLEIRPEGTNQVRMYHNDIAIGAAQTVPEALRANEYYGWLDAGGNSLGRCFVGDLQAVNIGSAGSSNTYSDTGYWYDLYNTMRPQYVVTRKNAAMNGNGIASYGLPNFANLAGSEQVIFDTTGDVVYPDSLWHIEAFIRKCYTSGYKVLVNVMPVWSNADLNNGQVNTPANQAAIEAIISLLDHYGIPYVNMWAGTQTHVTNGGNISDWFGDVYHLTDAGQLVAANALAPSYVTGGSFSLASRVYPESEALE